MPSFEGNPPLLTPNKHTQNWFDSTESKYWKDRRTDIALDDNTPRACRAHLGWGVKSHESIAT
jgi:hypothetical protein